MKDNALLSGVFQLYAKVTMVILLWLVFFHFSASGRLVAVCAGSKIKRIISEFGRLKFSVRSIESKKWS